MTEKNKTEEVNKELADLGVRQFVRNRMVKVLGDFAGTGKTKSVEDVLDAMNDDLLEEFKKIATEEAKKVFAEIGALLKEKHA